MSDARMNDIVENLKAGESLDATLSFQVMTSILGGEFSSPQIGQFLLALAGKGETASELEGFARAIRNEMKTVFVPEDSIDVCGTGGDGGGTFNVSTCVAFVAAASGAKVAKHGNRAVSSRSGSFDVLNELGVATSQEADHASESMSQFGLCFMFAPSFHPVLAQFAELRRNLGVRTAFNLLGPLLNPANVRRQLTGVYSTKYLTAIAQTLLNLGSEEAMIVCGEGGLDEFSLGGATQIAHMKNRTVTELRLDSSSVGLGLTNLSEILGGDAKENAKILVEILSGQKGAKRDLVALNTAAALMVAGRVKNFEEGLALAFEAIDSGRALKLLKAMQTSQTVRTGL